MKVASRVPLWPSTTVTSLIDRLGRIAESSFVIVPVAVARAIVAPDAPDRLTRNVSFGSTVVSPFTTTAIVFDVWPAVNVSVPDCAT